MPIPKLTLLAQQMLRWRLFSRRTELVDVWEVIKWWEIRRIAFNAIVGLTGLFTCFAELGGSWLMDRLGLLHKPLDTFLDLSAVLAYCLIANVCFTGGLVSEIVARCLWGGKTGSFGEITFFLGLVFSVALTLLPVALLSLVAIVGILTKQ